MSVIPATRGNDVVLSFRLASGGDPTNLTGRTIAFFDVPDALARRLSGALTDAEDGRGVLTVKGGDPIPRGLHRFGVQLRTATGANPIAFDLTLQVS
jgi:hypothetical protein